MSIIKDELNAIKTEFGTPRRTEILEMEGEVEDEDLIQREDMVVTVSHKGYIKRVPLSAYRAQRRGGKGRAGMATREEDFVTRIFIANTHTPVLFFSTRGMAYKMKVWRLPVAAPQARGKALVNLLPLDKDETITTILPLPEDEASWEKLDVMFATNYGSVRRNKLSDFIEVRQNGKIAMRLDAGDRIIGVEVCGENDDVLLTTADGQAIRFPVADVRVFKGRELPGVRGIKLERDDQVISMAILGHVEASPAERNAYVRQANSIRRGSADVEDVEVESNGQETVVLNPGALRRAQRARGVRSDGLGERLRQAHLGVRVPHLRPWRKRHHRHGREPAQRQVGRVVPRRGDRPDHARHRRRPTDPRPGAGHQHHGALDPGRDRVLHRRGRTRGFGGAHLRGERRRGRGARIAFPSPSWERDEQAAWDWARALKRLRPTPPPRLGATADKRPCPLPTCAARRWLARAGLPASREGWRPSRLEMPACA